MWNIVLQAASTISVDFWYGFVAASGALTLVNLVLLALELRGHHEVAVPAKPPTIGRAAYAEDTALVQGLDAEVTALRQALREARAQREFATPPCGDWSLPPATAEDFSEATTKKLVRGAWSAK